MRCDSLAIFSRRGRRITESSLDEGPSVNERIEVNPPSEHETYLVLVVSASGGVL